MRQIYKINLIYKNIQMNFVPAKTAREYFQCTGPTLQNWVNEGKLKVKKLSSRKFLYDIDSMSEEFRTNSDIRKSVIYARVSNTKQQNDLIEQINTIKSFCLSKGIQIDTVYKDIASGMNENRQDFNKLIFKVIQGKIKTVYVSFKDRLTRFGFEYFKYIFSLYNTEIVVLDDNAQNKTTEEELTADLISIIHHFSMKMYSSRRKKLREFKKFFEDDK